MTPERLKSLYDRHTRVLVVGDLILDRYIIGQVDRISPEAPVPICLVHEEKCVPGGAANVARNLADFGCSVDLLGVLGDGDLGARELQALCSDLGIRTDQCIAETGRPTVVKTRIVGNNQQIVRIDYEKNGAISEPTARDLASRCLLLAEEADLIIVSDYSKGTLTQTVVDALRASAVSGKIVAVDPHPSNLISWTGFSVIKPNFPELKRLAGMEISDYAGGDPRSSEDFREAVNRIREKWSPRHLLATLGPNGMYCTDTSGQDYWSPTRAAEIFDVSGAGDTSIAFFAIALAAGWTLAEAVDLAVLSSGIVVRKPGTSSVAISELEHELLRGTQH